MKILFLSTWFPYPLSQGSKIRAYYLLRALAQRHDVRLVTFRDTQVEPAWIEHIRQFCQNVEIVRRDPFGAERSRNSAGWFSIKPSSVIASESPEMVERVRQIVADWKPDRIVALTFVTAPYAAGLPSNLKPVDGLVVDVDNFLAPMLYEAYQQAVGLPSRMRRWLAWWKFQRYERWLFSQFDLCLVVADRDRRKLRQHIGTAPRIEVVSNGVDTQSNPYRSISPKPKSLVFNGALTYQANYDAMDYFLREIFPTIQSQVASVQLQITGKTDGVRTANLPLTDQVRFTGYLDDVRPTVAESWVCVVPLRMGAGTRLKILEAMALGTPVVSTSKGAEGLDAADGESILIADTANDFAAQTVRLLRDVELHDKLAQNARRLVEQKYDWSTIGNRFCDMIENTNTRTE